MGFHAASRGTTAALLLRSAEGVPHVNERLRAAFFRVDRNIDCGIIASAMGRNCFVILMTNLEDGV